MAERGAGAAGKAGGAGYGVAGLRTAVLAAVRHENFVLVVLLGAFVAFFAIATHGTTIVGSNVTNVLAQSAVRGVAACGQALVILTAGIDLSVGGVSTASIMVGGILMTSDATRNLGGWPMPAALGILIMLLIGTAFGLTNGMLVSRFRLPALIVTLGVWQIGKGLAFVIAGPGYVKDLPDSLNFGQKGLGWDPVPIFVFIIVYAVAYYALHHTSFGKEVYAVGGNPRAAFMAGVRVERVRLIAFTLAGLLYGLSSVLSLSRFMAATMQQSEGLELDTIGAVVIGGVSLAGGKGSIAGAFIGALIMGVVSNGLNAMGMQPSLTVATKGAIVILAVGIDMARRRNA